MTDFNKNESELAKQVGWEGSYKEELEKLKKLAEHEKSKLKSRNEW